MDERKKVVHILSAWGDVKDSDMQSRFNEETKRKSNMIIDYNKSNGGVDKLDQFRSYYDVELLKNILLLILLFVSKNRNQTMHVTFYYLIKMPYYMPLLTFTPNLYSFYSNCKIKFIYQGSG